MRRDAVVGIEGHDEVALTEGWQCCATPPGRIADPTQLTDDLDWLDTRLPATAAAALRSAGRWSLDASPRRFDAEDWWWRARFHVDEVPCDEIALCFDGLATLAEVWLDGQPLFQSEDMFLPHDARVTLAGDHELVIACRSLDEAMKTRRPRPRWRAPMVENQRLAWYRTTLLGRTPGWSPPAAPVGPWQPIRLERRRRVAVETMSLRPTIVDRDGVVTVVGRLRALGTAALTGARLSLSRGGETWTAPLTLDGDELTGQLTVPNAARWWPFTHGEPARYGARIELDVAPTPGATPDHVTLSLGSLGFRTITIDRTAFAVRVNDVEIFCRGACWTPPDPVAMRSDPAEHRRMLELMRAAGMNMVRVGGTMTYEDRSFYETADALGILVWQDLMFANMDYPTDEPFVAVARAEVDHQLARLAAHPSLAVICGNSEAEQQAAMWGAPRESWPHPLFHDTFAAIAARHCPDLPYWPSSAHGGAFPHQCDVGTTSYYGVGAYERPLEDARRSRVRFATECLAFANVPSPAGIEAMPEGLGARVHQPQWKARTPRDLGAGWDFDDIRDHYLTRLFDLDPARLRYADHDRYLALGRATTAEVMAATFGEWRCGRSACRGALVWFLRDLWQGAGWGLLDATGAPKLAFHALRRALQPVALHCSDEGNNGVAIHATNDGPLPFAGELRLSLHRGETSVGRYRRALKIPARGQLELPAAELLEGFADLSYAYRFGPPTCDLLHAALYEGDTLTAESFHLPLGPPKHREPDLGLSATARVEEGGDVVVTVSSRRFAYGVVIDVPGYLPTDDGFHLPPGGQRIVKLTRTPTAKRIAGRVSALNGQADARITL
ncbi:MAG: hypothetical protein R3B72_08675 [Polyangiaceae bacterium]